MRNKKFDPGKPIYNLRISLDVSDIKYYLKPDKILENYNTVEEICNLIRKANSIFINSFGGLWLITEKGFLIEGIQNGLKELHTTFDIELLHKRSLDRLYSAYYSDDEKTDLLTGLPHVHLLGDVQKIGIRDKHLFLDNFYDAYLAEIEETEAVAG